jgi:hypothetical protein
MDFLVDGGRRHQQKENRYLYRFCIVQRATAQSKQDFFVIMVQLRLLRGFKPAGLTVFIFLSLSVHFACSSGFSVKGFVLMRVRCRIEA